jgi:hypothetical protein
MWSDRHCFFCTIRLYVTGLAEDVTDTFILVAVAQLVIVHSSTTWPIEPRFVVHWPWSGGPHEIAVVCLDQFESLKVRLKASTSAVTH